MSLEPDEETHAAILERRVLRHEPAKAAITRLISAREVAEFYGISHSTLWRWIKDGRVPAPIRIGRRTFWEAQTLLKHVAGLRTQQNDTL